MTEAESFLNSAKDSSLWLHKANALFYSAETLFKESAQLRLETSEIADTPEGHNNRLQKSLNLLHSSQLLYGYAMETLLKCILITTKPESVEFDLRSDASGNILEAKISQIGVPMNKGHDLSSLANAVGLIERSQSPKEVKGILDYLTECVQWRARYPTPQHSKKNSPLPSDKVANYMLHEFRYLFVPVYEDAIKLLDEMLESYD
ncbi:hypothetical protein NDL36_000465 [Vibrio parahaemolyticus]|nr:hypothetical protein [Vibrio parahaemolyticus]